jgi:hypothetical protein
MSEHFGWRIGVTPHRDGDGRWRALLEVWEPGLNPLSIPALTPRFDDDADSEADVINLARAIARVWIDQQPGFRYREHG